MGSEDELEGPRLKQWKVARICMKKKRSEYQRRIARMLSKQRKTADSYKKEQQQKHGYGNEDKWDKPIYAQEIEDAQNEMKRLEGKFPSVFVGFEVPDVGDLVWYFRNEASALLDELVERRLDPEDVDVSFVFS